MHVKLLWDHWSNHYRGELLVRPSLNKLLRHEKKTIMLQAQHEFVGHVSLHDVWSSTSIHFSLYWHNKSTCMHADICVFTVETYEMHVIKVLFLASLFEQAISENLMVLLKMLRVVHRLEFTSRLENDWFL